MPIDPKEKRPTLPQTTQIANEVKSSNPREAVTISLRAGDPQAAETTPLRMMPTKKFRRELTAEHEKATAPLVAAATQLRSDLRRNDPGPLREAPTLIWRAPEVTGARTRISKLQLRRLVSTELTIDGRAGWMNSPNVAAAVVGAALTSAALVVLAML